MKPSEHRYRRRSSQKLSKTLAQERQRIEKASAILRCRVLISRHHPEEPIEVELPVDVAFNHKSTAAERLL